MRIGIVSSSGGSVMAAAIDILHRSGNDLKTFVVTDRACGAEKLSENLGVEWKRIEEPDMELFSEKAATWLYDVNKVDWVCLFFLRLVSSKLFESGNCVNIHPSLLPAFAGFNAVNRCVESGARFIGATAHFVDQTVDGGQIFAQVVSPIKRDISIAEAERISFAQKIYLFLVSYEMFNNYTMHDVHIEQPVRTWANPALQDERIEKMFREFLREEGIEWGC